MNTASKKRTPMFGNNCLIENTRDCNVTRSIRDNLDESSVLYSTTHIAIISSLLHTANICTTLVQSIHNDTSSSLVIAASTVTSPDKRTCTQYFRWRCKKTNEREEESKGCCNIIWIPFRGTDCWLKAFNWWVEVVQLQPSPEFFDHRLKIFNELKTEYDTWVSCMFVLFWLRCCTYFLVLKRNQGKRSPLPCLMAQNGRAKVGKLVRWISPKKCQRVCQSVWWLPRYETLDRMAWHHTDLLN